MTGRAPINYRPVGSLGRAILLLQLAEAGVIRKLEFCTETEAAKLHELQLKIMRGIAELRDIAGGIGTRS